MAVTITLDMTLMKGKITITKLIHLMNAFQSIFIIHKRINNQQPADHDPSSNPCRVKLDKFLHLLIQMRSDDRDDQPPDGHV